MNNLNYLVIEGHLCQTPSLKSPIEGKNVCSFTIAVNRSFIKDVKKNEYVTETSFFPITVWGDMGVVCFKYLRQGRGIRVVGRLKQEHWKDKDGNARQRVVIIAEHVEFMPSNRKPEELDKEEKEVIHVNENSTAKESEAPEGITEDQMNDLIENDPQMSPAPEDPSQEENSPSEEDPDGNKSEDEQ